MHDVLATVDDEQHLLVFEERDQTGNRIVRFLSQYAERTRAR